MLLDDKLFSQLNDNIVVLTPFLNDIMEEHIQEDQTLNSTEYFNLNLGCKMLKVL